ncbi:hypothetical protein [Bosea lupini]|nr:hypothetical protein [Bosea lupini]
MMARPFRSKFQFYDELIDTLREDRFHIGVNHGPPERRRGNHIGVMHDALITWASHMKGADIAAALAAMKAEDVASQTFGNKTSTLVRLFKTHGKILNGSGAIDPVVGKKTISSLDDVLPVVDREKLKRDKAEREKREKTENTLDIVVIYDGGKTFSQTKEDNEATFPITDADPYSRTGRKIFRMSATTASIGVASIPFLTRHSNLIQKKLEGREVGKICIAGSSSGGRNAVDLAARLHFAGLPVAYLAMADAAFFPIEAKNSPVETNGRLNTPLFGPFANSAAARQNFFQTVGNRSELAIFGMRRIFSSNMANKEIHGSVSGFTDRPLTSRIQAQNPKNDDDAHSRAVGDGMETALKEIRELLNAL